MSPAEADEPARAAAGDGPEDRYSRLRLIGWWDQKRLAAARVVREIYLGETVLDFSEKESG